MSRRLVRLTSRVRRCASSSETFRLTVASGIPSLRAAADRLPASTAASSVDMDSNRSIWCFQKTEGWFLIIHVPHVFWKNYVRLVSGRRDLAEGCLRVRSNHEHGLFQ